MKKTRDAILPGINIKIMFAAKLPATFFLEQSLAGQGCMISCIGELVSLLRKQVLSDK